MSKVQEKIAAFKRENPAFQNMKFLNFISIFVGNFYPPGSGSTDLTESETLIKVKEKIFRASPQ
jgi:hypothetical protein